MLMAKKEGNRFRFKKYGNPDGQGYRCYSCGSGRLTEIDTNKAYVGTLYCEKFCRKCYHFGTDWDVRCTEHNNKPIHQVYRKCPHFLKAKKVADEIKAKMETDDNFNLFCRIVNKRMLTGGGGRYNYDDLEAFLGIFNF